MAMSWTIPKKTVELARTALETEIAKAALPSFAQIIWENNELCVKIDKAGKSEFRMALKPEGDNVKMIETKRDVALFHRPFVDKVEGYVQQILSGVGASKA
jgi:hypothetical protein